MKKYVYIILVFVIIQVENIFAHNAEFADSLYTVAIEKYYDNPIHYRNSISYVDKSFDNSVLYRNSLRESIDSLRTVIKSRESGSKFFKNKNFLRNQIIDDLLLEARLKDLERIDSITMIDLENQLSSELSSTKVIKMLTTPSDSVFITPLPDENDVPLSLLNHYRLLRKFREFKEMLETVEDRIRRLEAAHSDDDRESRKLIISKSIATRITALANSWAELSKMYWGTLSEQQSEYVDKNISAPYFSVVDNYSNE